MTNIPNGWQLTELENCFEILDSKRVPVSAKERTSRIDGKKEEDLIPYYGATGQAGFIDDYLFDEELIALGEDGVPFFDPLKTKAYMLRGKTWVNNHAHVLKASSGIQNQLMCHYLNQVDYHGYVNGATRLKLTQANMKKLLIKVPPLNEQTRIANKLDELLAQVDTIKARVDAIPDILKRFRQSVLAAAVSGRLTDEWREKNKSVYDIDSLKKNKKELLNDKLVKKDLDFENGTMDFELPSSWFPVKLKSVAKKITDGEHKTPKREYAGRYLLSARNVRDGFIDLTKVDYVGEEEYKKLRKRCNPDTGDVLVSCSGSVGRVSLVDKSDSYVMVRSAALVKTLKGFIKNEFLMYCLRSPQQQKVIESKAKSTAQANLFLGPIKDLDIPLPSMEEQTEIVNRVEKLFAFADQIEQRVQDAQSRIDMLTQSILAKAFRGELVEQDPSDEPASELLARIKAEREAAAELAKAAKKAPKKTPKRTIKKKQTA